MLRRMVLHWNNTDVLESTRHGVPPRGVELCALSLILGKVELLRGIGWIRLSSRDLLWVIPRIVRLMAIKVGRKSVVYPWVSSISRRILILLKVVVVPCGVHAMFRHVGRVLTSIFHARLEVLRHVMAVRAHGHGEVLHHW